MPKGSARTLPGPILLHDKNFIRIYLRFEFGEWSYLLYGHSLPVLRFTFVVTICYAVKRHSQGDKSWNTRSTFCVDLNMIHTFLIINFLLLISSCMRWTFMHVSDIFLTRVNRCLLWLYYAQLVFNPTRTGLMSYFKILLIHFFIHKFIIFHKRKLFCEYSMYVLALCNTVDTLAKPGDSNARTILVP